MTTIRIPQVDCITARYGGQDRIVLELSQGDTPVAEVAIGACAGYDLVDQLRGALSFDPHR